MKLQPILLLAVLLALPAGAGAADLYVGVGLGDKVAEGGAGGGLDEFGPRADDNASKIYFGAALGRHWGVEGSYYDFGRRICCPGLADAGFEDELEAYSLTAIGRLPRERFELFAKAGLLAWDESGTGISIAGPFPIETDGNDPMFGVGASLRLLEHLGVRAEWESYEFGQASGDAFWVSAEVRF